VVAKGLAPPYGPTDTELTSLRVPAPQITKPGHKPGSATDASLSCGEGSENRMASSVDNQMPALR
jgi:hypothetical protein